MGARASAVKIQCGGARGALQSQDLRSLLEFPQFSNAYSPSRTVLYSTRLYSESEGQLEKQSIQTRLLHSLARKAKALPHFPPSALGEGKEI